MLPSYLTENYLRNQARSGLLTKNANLKSSKFGASKSIFLSHSHKDKELVEGFIALLATFEIEMYVDWKDDMMPRVTNKETAQNIKTKINDLEYFFVLATKNAMTSRWVPWEIGIADILKTPDKIALIPVADEFGNFYGNEYLQLYQTIEIGDAVNYAMKALAIFPPLEGRGKLLGAWLNEKRQ